MDYWCVVFDCVLCCMDFVEWEILVVGFIVFVLVVGEYFVVEVYV